MSIDPAPGRRIRRTSRVLSVLTYGALAVCILGTAGVAVGYAKAESKADSFTAAAACSAAGNGNCAQEVQEQPVEVVDAGEKSSRSTTYWLEVAGVLVSDQVVDLDCTNDSSFFMTAQGHGSLTAEVWQGKVLDLTYNGTASCGTDDNPTTEATIWLIVLGILGSMTLGWLARMARNRFARTRRSRMLTGAAVTPIYLNILLFPVLVGILGTRSLWPYLLAYAIGVALETPFVIKSARRRAAPASGPRAYRRAPGYAPARTSKTVDADQARRRGRITLYVLIGLCLLGTAIMLAFYIPAQSNAFAYENAPACQGTTTSGCVDHVTANVVDNGMYQTDSGATNWIEISGPGISVLQFNLSGDNASGIDALQTGSSLTALLWQGRVTEVEYQGSTSPGPGTPMLSAAHLLGGVFAFAGVALCFILLRLTVRAKRRMQTHLLVICAIAALFGGIFAFAPMLAATRPVWWAFPLTFGIAAVVTIPIYALVVAANRRKARRRNGPRVDFRTDAPPR